MKNVFITALFLSGALFSTVVAKADAGSPKGFTLLTSVSGPTVSGQISEIKLANLTMSKDETCSDLVNYDYSGPAIHLTIGDQEYVMDQTTSVSVSFNSASCDLKAQNIQGFMAKFDNTKLHISVGVDFELATSYVQIASRDLGTMTGTITSRY